MKDDDRFKAPRECGKRKARINEYMYFCILSSDKYHDCHYATPLGDKCICYADRE